MVIKPLVMIVGSITSRCSGKWAHTHPPGEDQRPDPGDGGNRAYHDRCNIFPGLSYHKANNTFLNSVRKNNVEAQVEFTFKVMERTRVTCYRWCISYERHLASLCSSEFLRVGVYEREICVGKASRERTRELAAKSGGSLVCPFTCHSPVTSCLQVVFVRLCASRYWFVANMLTHVFVPQLFDLEERRKQGMHRLAVLIQKIFRGWRQQKQVCWLNLVEKKCLFATICVLCNCFCNRYRGRTGQLLGTLRSNDATATRTSLKK